MNEACYGSFPARAVSQPNKALLPLHKFTGLFRQGRPAFPNMAMQIFGLLIANFKLAAVLSIAYFGNC